MLDELEDVVVEIDVEDVEEIDVDDCTVLDEEVSVRRVEEELDDVDDSDTKVAALNSEEEEL